MVVAAGNDGHEGNPPSPTGSSTNYLWREILARPGFGEGPATVGAELELCLVDGRGRARITSSAAR